MKTNDAEGSSPSCSTDLTRVSSISGETLISPISAKRQVGLCHVITHPAASTTTSSICFATRNPCAGFAQDRAATVATAIWQITQQAVLAWFERGGTALADVRGEITEILRNEFADIARTTLTEI